MKKLIERFKPYSSSTISKATLDDMKEGSKTLSEAHKHSRKYHAKQCAKIAERHRLGAEIRILNIHQQRLNDWKASITEQISQKEKQLKELEQ